MTDARPAGLALQGVCAAHGAVEVLRAIDLTVARGELLVVLGPSGAGKSTLLRVVAGLQATTAGRVSIAGRDVTRLRPGRRNVSMVFQSYALFPHLTVADNIGFGLLVRDTPRAARRERAERATAAVGCAHLLDRHPHQLSGGERQRVALAGHLFASRTCSCSTSHCPIWTSSCARRPGRSCGRCTSGWAARRCT
jgi:ABC-type sugar transport system ATPase subunit